MMLTLGGVIVGAALWFCYLQLFVLHAFCKYCTLLHLLGCVLAGLILVAGRTLRLSKGRYGWFAVGLVSAAVFAFVQSRTLPAAAYDTGRTEAALPTFSEGEVPVLGPLDAPEELTLLFDFQCIHCRRLHPYLPELLEKAGGQYRIHLCPVPLSSDCNPYIPATGVDRFAGSCPLTRYALAVWYACPDAYGAYWDYLLGDGDERAAIAPAEAEARARALLGDDFKAATQDPRIDAYLRKVEELFGRTSNAEKSGVPRLIHGQKWLVPETDQADELLELIRLSL
jgi:protein-disulfide isomerase